MITGCCCGAPMRAEAVEEVSPLLYNLRLGCSGCANWIVLSGRLEEIEPMVSSRLWSREAQHELDRLPPYVSPLVRNEVEAYAEKEGRHLITVALLRDARNRGKVSWTAAAQQRLSNIPDSIRSMAKVEIERMAIEQGLPEVTESLMNEAKAKFLGMRG